MRRTSRALLSSILLATIGFAAAPVFATKPSQPPGQAKHASSKQQAPAKSGNRSGSERAASSKQPGFVASSGHSNQVRGDNRHDDHDRNDWRDRDWDRRDWDRHDWDRHDSRWDHNDWDRDRWRNNDRRDYVRYYYPRPGYVVHRLPLNYRVVPYYGVPYYYGGGSWYRSHGSLFTIVTPPPGLMISFLPDVYTTLSVGGVPYYRANDVYYRWRPDHRAYVVTAPPPGYY